MVIVVAVALVAVRLVEFRVVTVDEEENSEAIVAKEIVVVARLDVPVAVRVPTVRFDDDAFVRLV